MSLRDFVQYQGRKTKNYTVSLLCYTRSESSIITIQNQKGTTDVKKKIKLLRNEQEKIEKIKE